MNRTSVKALSLAMTGVISMSVLTCTSCSFPGAAEPTYVTRWEESDGNRYLLDEGNNSRLTGWQEFEGAMYYFDLNGVMQTGWLDYDGNWYYLEENGTMMTGLNWIGNELCYFRDNGTLVSGKKPEEDEYVNVRINIPNYNQHANGYPLGCEGVSLYMALKGLGYVSDMTLDEFMDTMPYGGNPYEGYMGNPKVGRDGENEGKRTSIYPEPLSKWASQYAHAKDLTGASTEDLMNELHEGHVVLVYVTGGWNKPVWKKFPWSVNEKGDVTNNHCLCVVGECDDGSIIVNDCASADGEYKVEYSKFRTIYEARTFAVSVY